jgi:hypothetical protein
MKVGIYGQFYHEHSDTYIQLLLEALYDEDISVYIEDNFLKLITKNKEIDSKFSNLSTFKELDNSFDLFFSIGGDGTLLKSVTYVKDLNIPIAGINTGRLGFLASIQKEELSEGFNQLLNGNYSCSERSLLSIELSGESEGETPELTVEAAAAILGTDPDLPDGETVAAEARDLLLLGMTTAVVDVDAVAAGLDIDIDPKEVQQKVEGRHPMTLAEYAHVHAFLE